MSVEPHALTELYRDPVYDGATDPVVRVGEDGLWWMFYTQRRATHPDPGPDVAWVHGSRIGVAHSRDGLAWHYAGTLEPEQTGLRLRPGAPPTRVDRTYWAPEVVHDGTRWRMYATEIDGVPTRWPGHARRIVEYVSDDLHRWRRRGPLALSSDRVIDAAVARTDDGRWRMWWKDEAAGSVTATAVSDDLDSWRAAGVAIGGRAHEGPVAFSLGGWWWMIVDEWRGMAVHRSPDAVAWTRQGGPDDVVLGAGAVPGPGFGHHGAVLQHEGATWLYFFGHPARAYDPDSTHPGAVDERRCAVYRVRPAETGGTLVVA